MLTVLDRLPPGLLEVAASDLHRLLPGPTLIHLPGRREPPLFVSVLLHGNEDTGLAAMQTLLSRHAGRELPRALSLFIGNVEAARRNLRRLENQPDFNRVWPSGTDPDPAAPGPERTMAREVLAQMRARGVFASIDIHNNTGLNPHYACVRDLAPAFLHLATLFSRVVVHFETPLGTQTGAFAPLCPAVTLECGKPGNSGGEAHAAQFVDAALHLDHFPAHAVPAQDIDLYRTVGVVRVREGVSFGFGSHDAQMSFVADLDHLNFRDLAPDTPLARVAETPLLPLQVLDDSGHDVTEHYFAVRDGALLVRRPSMAAMLTTDAQVIRQDCLCYLMERQRPPG
jgi:succinylglutamate desuccinylase